MLVDHDLSPSQARNLERATGAEVLDRSARDPRDLPAPRAQPRGAPAGRDRAALSTSRRACARRAAAQIARAAASAAKGAGESSARARSPQDPRPHRRAAPGARCDRARVRHAPQAPRRARHGRARRLHERGQVVWMRALTGSDVLVAGQAVRDARHHRARAAARDDAAHPRLRHRRLHQEAAARSRRELPLDARRGARRAICWSTWSTPPMPRSRRRSRSRARCWHDIGADESPALLVLNKADRLDARRARTPRRRIPRRAAALVARDNPT